ncbi:hypothetical protein [Microvirga sp. Mcv34]|uniref:hypothetical protein n=1 Tax=Microvirga sp. Mcv34 TaxID=2926016 RepID=UPI0021C71D58|nr:hypothetical protein [Microvirga sp. Mcv34]
MVDSSRQNSATILQDAYRLLSLVAGDPVILAMGTPQDPLMRLRDEFLVGEVARLLVSTAAMSRIRNEQLKMRRDEPAQPGLHSGAEDECGTLWPDIMEQVEIPLTFQEACDRIVHANNIVPEAAGSPAETPFSSNIVLKGRLEGRAWAAHIDMVAYVRACAKSIEVPNDLD